MKKKETSLKLPYSSPAIDVISLHNRQAIMDVSGEDMDMGTIDF